MTYDILIIIKTFYMSSHTYGENFVSFGSAGAEKTEKISMDGQHEDIMPPATSSMEAYKFALEKKVLLVEGSLMECNCLLQSYAIIMNARLVFNGIWFSMSES